MKKIILANLGNRNITYKEKSFPDQKQTFPEMSFRSFTEWLLNNFETEKPFIGMAILPDLFEDIDITNCQKLILFFSDIQGGDRNDQDTIHEAKIIRRLTNELYPHLEVDLKGVYCSVTDNDGLMQTYRRHLLEITKEHPDAFYIVCDAGGTAQQKAALKILIEFLFHQNQFTAYNVLQNSNRKIEEVKSIEYRKVINQEQIRSLIRKFNYVAAYEIYSQNSSDQDLLFNYLNVVKLLFANEIEAALTLAGKAHVRINEDMRLVKSKETFSSSFNMWSDILRKDSYFRLCLLLDIAASYQKRFDKGFTILFHHIFIERFCSEVANTQLQGKDIDEQSHWSWIKSQISTGAKFPNFIAPFSIENVGFASFPIKLALARSLTIPKVDEVVNLMPAQRQLTFSTLRNKFAHQGKSISEENITSFHPVFVKWRQQFGLDPTHTLFDWFNNALIKMIH